MIILKPLLYAQCCHHPVQISTSVCPAPVKTKPRVPILSTTMSATAQPVSMATIVNVSHVIG